MNATTKKYSIVLFAYNEEKNIANTLHSIVNNTDEKLHSIFVLANGCTDNTVAVANSALNQLSYGDAHVIDIKLGDKCNAWNEYAHNYLSEADVHFFVDSDVVFTKNAFPILFEALLKSDRTAITGLPQSGRNIERYTELVVRYSCLSGNLYGLKREFLQRIREKEIGLPIGLSWIDSQITKMVNEDLNDKKDDYQHRVTYVAGVGYQFSSLKPWSKDDIKLYINRIVRYKTGQLQEVYLDALPFTQWPKNMTPINEQVLAKGISAKELGWKVLLKPKILKRLTRKFS